MYWDDVTITPSRPMPACNQLSAICVVQDSAGRLQAFALGNDGNVYINFEQSTTGPWNGWSSLGGSIIASTPTVIQDSEGRLQAFAIGIDGNVYINYWLTANGPWSGWTNFGGSIIVATPTVIQDNAGRLQVFALGNDGNVYINFEQSTSGPWSGWSNFGGSLIAATPTVIQDNAGRLQAFALGSDGNVYTNYWLSANGPWSGWSNFGGGIIASGPTVVQDNAGRLQLFALGTDGNVYINYWLSANGPWSGWSNFGGSTIASAPEAVLDSTGRLQVFAVGTDGNVYVNFEETSDGPWNGWSNFGGGIVTGAPAAITDTRGLLNLFALGTDGNVYTNYWLSTSGPWNGWSNFGGRSGAIKITTALPTISGQVFAGGTGLSGIGMNLSGDTGAGTGVSLSTTTNSAGSYSFAAPVGGTYTVTPSLSGYTFDPGTATFSNLSSSQTVNFAVMTQSVGENGTPIPQPPATSAPAPQPPPVVSASVTNCNDISGIWTDSTNPVATWSLRQTGQLVTGTVTANRGCGASTWTVAGQITGVGQYTLMASDPIPAVDGCGLAAFDSVSSTVTFSPNVCAIGSATEVFTTSHYWSGSQYLPKDPTSTSANTTWSHASPSPGLQITVDLLNDKVTTNLSGQNKTNDVSVKIIGPSQTTLAQHNDAIAGSSFNDSLQRTSLAVGQYGLVTATWGDASVSVPVNFYIIGNTRFSQYNFPYESQCSSNAQQAWIIYKIDSSAGGSCYYRSVSLGSRFMTQTVVNGTGVSNTNEILKSYDAGAKYICSPAPGGNKDNTFFAVDAGGSSINKITGKCNTVLSDGTRQPNSLVNDNPLAGTLATSPAPAGISSIYACSDQVLMIDQSNNYDLRTVQDTCPACNAGFGSEWGGTVAHIDTFNSAQTCNPNDLGDYGNRVAIRLR